MVCAQDASGDRYRLRGGTGKVRLYRINQRHPLAAPLDALFGAEEVRYARIREAVSSAASEVKPAVLAAWIYGSVARGEDRPGSDLDMAIIARPEEIEPALHRIRKALAVSGEEPGFVPSVVGLSPDDITRLSSKRDPWWASVAAVAQVVLGAHPEELTRRRRRGRASA
jgi:predicted nucleotidyltransferase